MLSFIDYSDIWRHTADPTTPDANIAEFTDSRSPLGAAHTSRIKRVSATYMLRTSRKKIFIPGWSPSPQCEKRTGRTWILHPHYQANNQTYVSISINSSLYTVSNTIQRIVWHLRNSNGLVIWTGQNSRSTARHRTLHKSASGRISNWLYKWIWALKRGNPQPQRVKHTPPTYNKKRERRFTHIAKAYHIKRKVLQ